MMSPLVASLILLIVLGTIVCYYDMRYRRIPNQCVVIGALSGLAIHTWFGGWIGLRDSFIGAVSAFCLMLLIRCFSGATGPGDVKWFAAIGAMVGAKLVLPAFLTVLLMGGLLGFFTILGAGNVKATVERIKLIFYGLMPGHQLPRFAVPADRKQALPYGLAICLGSLLTIVRQLGQSV